ncbi:DUF4348 domain-containing protein [Cytophagaceae bacterium DM2B3-1]|uniref:DUF4348 domain-containing protein n=1 Tax=Xanthocytophaga flava TaxID=3048013 RepID=A0ABT7CSB4_9BACT|nr:DUF4348 domain-containing protein [Xanthocytophaga flavus]MDJ1468636.1 DUF4348 domain-containing protein [Xanthocytophaga flavus]MDJ1496416.1 DUF4348 domain-containing protein [Xanthocytophaga flavus]
MTKSKSVFDPFFQKFSKDSIYQKQHISFPLPYYEWDIENKLSEEIINRNQWKFINFSKDKYMSSREIDAYTQVSVQKKDTLIYIRNGIDNGIRIEYFFTQKDKMWYLVKIIDKSM